MKQAIPILSLIAYAALVPVVLCSYGNPLVAGRDKYPLLEPEPEYQRVQDFIEDYGPTCNHDAIQKAINYVVRCKRSGTH